MNQHIVDIVKESVSCKDFAEHIGLSVNRSGFCCCPFHGEKTPSLKIYSDGRGWYCFGCHQGGDVINMAKLYYNEFNCWRPSKLAGIVRLVKMLQADGIRIDGVGIQAHWGLGYPKNEYVVDAIEQLAALGVKVNISELDVDVLPISKDAQVIGRSLRDPQYQLEEFEAFLDPYKEGLPEEVEDQLAARYEELFRIFYEHRDQISRVTFWTIA